MSSSKAVKAGETYVKASLDDKPLKKALKTTGKLFASWGGKAAKAMALATGGISAIVGALTTLAGVLSGTLALNKFLDMGKELGVFASKADIGVEAMSELDYAAKQFGATGEDVSEALLELRRRVAEGLSDGAGPAINGLKILGLELEKIAAMRPEEQMAAIAQAMKDLGDNDLAAFAADELFGSDAEKFLPLLMQGKEGIAAMRAEARELGLVMEQEDVEAASKLNQAIAKLGAMWDSVLVQVGAALAPLLIKAGEVLQTYIQPALQQISGLLEDVEEHFEQLIAQPSMWGESLRRVFDILNGYLTKAAATFADLLLTAIMEALAASGLGMDDAIGRIGDVRSGVRIAGHKAGRDAEAAWNRDIFAGGNRRITGGVGPLTPEEQAARVMAGRNYTDKSIYAGLPPMQAPAIPKTLDYTSAGTFSGAAAGLLGKADNPITKAIDESNKTLKKIETNTREGGATFG